MDVSFNQLLSGAVVHVNGDVVVPVDVKGFQTPFMLFSSVDENCMSNGVFYLLSLECGRWYKVVLPHLDGCENVVDINYVLSTIFSVKEYIVSSSILFDDNILIHQRVEGDEAIEGREMEWPSSIGLPEIGVYSVSDNVLLRVVEEGRRYQICGEGEIVIATSSPEREVTLHPGVYDIYFPVVEKQYLDESCVMSP